jgi:phosphatidylserine/phosphatidylglycerophosphate/cardiolipin synthase-like enzyme
MERKRRPAMTIMTWFDKQPLSPLVPDPAIILGGTTLVNEFISLVEESAQPGHLAIAVPFINPRLVNELRTWQGIVHQRLTCTIVTASSPASEDACRGLLALPWRSLTVQQSRTLHAKTYAFAGTSGFRAALVGSHNLTYAGTRHNQEAGVLLVSRMRTEVSTAIDRFIEHISTIGNGGTTLYDGTAWPEGILQLRKTA